MVDSSCDPILFSRITYNILSVDGEKIDLTGVLQLIILTPPSPLA